MIPGMGWLGWWTGKSENEHMDWHTREELAYILDTFPIVPRKDEAQYGEYRTKRMVLEKYDGLESLSG